MIHGLGEPVPTSSRQPRDWIDFTCDEYRDFTVVYHDGFLCRNVRSFDTVDFCFICDEPSVLGGLVPLVACTGMKLDPETAIFVPIYRQLFLCETCYAAHCLSSRHTTTLTLCERARSYFDVSSSPRRQSISANSHATS